MQKVAAYTCVSTNEQTDGYERDTQRLGLQSLLDAVRDGVYLGDGAVRHVHATDLTDARGPRAAALYRRDA